MLVTLGSREEKGTDGVDEFLNTHYFAGIVIGRRFGMSRTPSHQGDKVEKCFGFITSSLNRSVDVRKGGGKGGRERELTM